MLRIRSFIILGCVVLFAVSSFAQTDSLPSDSELAAITARGRLLYEYDEAAWHATDAVLATNPSKDEHQHFLAQKTDSGWIVAFGHLSETRDSFLIRYKAIQGKNPLEFSVIKLDPLEQDTGFFLAAAKALETALHDFRGPDRPYNAAVLPAPLGQLYVYMVPAQTENGVYPLGADVRYLISSDGGAIVEKRQLHKGIIPNGGPIPAGATQVGGVHSHVLSNVPEDTDVFHVLTRKPSMPETIVTQIAIYEVSVDGSIKIVQRMKKHH